MLDLWPDYSMCFSYFLIEQLKRTFISVAMPINHIWVSSCQALNEYEHFFALFVSINANDWIDNKITISYNQEDIIYILDLKELDKWNYSRLYEWEWWTNCLDWSISHRNRLFAAIAKIVHFGQFANSEILLFAGFCVPVPISNRINGSSSG